MKAILSWITALIFAAPLFAQQDLTLMITNQKITGNTVTYDVKAENFTDMIAVQYAIVYDSEKLAFSEFRNFSLPDLDQGDFNPNVPGVIKHVWLQNSLEGVTTSADDVQYQIVFTMKAGTPGDVCFSEDALTTEFIHVDMALLSYMIVDDCHSEPYEINLSTDVQEIADRFGLRVQNPVKNHQVQLMTQRADELEIQIYHTSGQMVQAFPKTSYPAGTNTLQLKKSLPIGVYILHTEIDDTAIALKLIVE